MLIGTASTLILFSSALGNQSFESRAQDLIKEGQTLMRAGKAREALLLFRQAQSFHRLLSKQSLDIGKEHFKKRNLNSAKVAFRRALEFEYQNPLANLGLGRTHLRERNYPDAITYLSRALLLSPDLSDARDLLKQAIKAHQGSDLTSHLRHYTFPGEAIVFKDNDSLRVEIAYALPKIGLAAAGGINTAHIDQRLSFTNQSGKTLSFSQQPTHLPQAGKTSLRTNYLLGIQTIYIPLNTYLFALNIKDHKIASRGLFQSTCLPPTDEIDFGISDLLTARKITAKTLYPETRNDLQIERNPLKLYRHSEPIFVYLELYNLLPDISGQTDYELTYMFQWPDSREIDLRHFEALDRDLPLNLPEEISAMQLLVPHEHRQGLVINSNGNTDRATRVTIPYTGRQRDDFTYLELSVDHLEPGIHKLVISAKDLVAEETVQRSTLLRITK